MKSGGKVKLNYSFEGNGLVAWHDGDVRPPVSEIHCLLTTDVEMHLLANGIKVDCFYRVSGQFAFLGGMPTRNDTYWDLMWLPRDKFLSHGSFLIQ